MSDPRAALGLQIEPRVVGPFSVHPAQRVGDGSDGGILDVGIVARLPNGKRVVIGEIWAACPNEDQGKTRIDAEKVAKALCDHLNATMDLVP